MGYNNFYVRLLAVVRYSILLVSSSDQKINLILKLVSGFLPSKLHPPVIGICRSITKSVSKGLSRIFFHQKITALSQPCHKLTISADTLFRWNIGHVISVPQGMRVRYRTHE